MRRSTRLSLKKSSFHPDDSDDDETKEPAEKFKPKKRFKSSQKSIKEIETNFEHDNLTVHVKKQNIQKDSDGSSSESDIENYLQPVDQIDLSSTFFQLHKPDSDTIPSFESIENNIFANVDRLSGSDSSDVDEFEKKTKITAFKPIPEVNLEHLQEYTKKLEEAKKSVEKYEAKQEKLKKSNKKLTEENQDISNLLAVGEAKLNSSIEQQASIHSSDYESLSESEKEDWEEVKEQNQSEKIAIPKDDLQITVELPTVMRKKKGKDLVASMKRRLNRIRKQNQVLVHKVHLLCWLGHGNYVNQVINNPTLLALALSIVSPQFCSPFNLANLKNLEKIVKWFKVTVTNSEKRLPKDLTLNQLLKLQIIQKNAFNKKMLVLIFICLLRSLGIECRLVLSFQIAPLRPPASELHSESVRDKTKKEIDDEDKEDGSSKKSMVEEEIKTNENKKCTAEMSTNEKEPELEKEQHSQNNNEKGKNKKHGNQTKTIIINTAENSDECPESGKVNPKKAKKVSSKASKLLSNNNYKENVEKESLTNRTRTFKNKSSSPANTKILKQESLAVPDATKPKTRSQSTREDKSQRGATSITTTGKPKVRSQSVREQNSQKETKPQKKVQLDAKSPKTRRSLSLKAKNNNAIPQLDGADDSSDGESVVKKTTRIRKQTRRSKSLNYAEVDSDDAFEPEHTRRSTKIASKTNSNTNFDSANPERKNKKSELKRKSCRSLNRDSDDDYIADIEPTKLKQYDSEEDFHEKTVVKSIQRTKSKKGVAAEEPKTKKGVDVWLEVYLEDKEKWISIDIVKGQVHCVNELHARASLPISYIVAWNNDNSIKDVTQRYCPKWNTETRKLRINKKWWDETLNPFEGPKTKRDKVEDEELAQLQLEKPLPTTIHEYKNHPLYVLKRHLLKFQALYPPEPATLGFVRKEAVYSRDCVYTLHTRETWHKQAKEVKPGEQPYRILKTLKWDKINRKILRDQPLEVFGVWQVADYVPPVAENGIVPRNEYGNVELFQSCMLPKGTVHLQLPGLNKVARRMNMDCAPAMVGFDFHSGWTHPVFDGFVVCEEHSESLIAAWYQEQEEQEKREQEKIEKRVYGNWRRLIKGLLIRQRLQARYDFGVPSQTAATGKKRKSNKGPKFVSKKRRICDQNESESDSN